MCRKFCLGNGEILENAIDFKSASSQEIVSHLHDMLNSFRREDYYGSSLSLGKVVGRSSIVFF